ncbi:LLM class flavin-dependent oxidoreductase [Ilumatobacter sp.]|uniref:LLM class flavin-dependent oxidoreductase n=1 Tax=Ilumatobacter sp. TaxID=1967498 RepID=UPI003AF844B7
MHVGLSVIFQNPGRQRPDHEVYAADLRLARQAEPLGFDSIWSVEHHFTDYTMCPDVMQFLTYMAGCTERIQLGSMVCVLPWHDPLRVAEQIAMLDVMSGGRVVLGIGRGTGRVEFDGFRVEMPEARARFAEAADMILNGLDRGFVEYDGQYVRQPRVDLRPAPPSSFRGRTYAAAISPESAEIMAKMGVGILIVPQKPWKTVRTELAAYRSTFLAATSGRRRRRTARAGRSSTSRPIGPRRWHGSTSAGTGTRSSSTTSSTRTISPRRRATSSTARCTTA